MTTEEYLEITAKSSLAISWNEEETNSNEDVDEADGAADCEAYIQPGTVIEGDEYAAETFLSMLKFTLYVLLTLEQLEARIHLENIK